MDDGERRALLAGLLRLSAAPEHGRPIEPTVVVRSQVCPWRYPPIGDFLYGEWLRADFEAGRVPAPEVMPDLAVVITMVSAADRALVGPPPARLLDPVPHADLVRASVAGIPELLDDLDGDTRNVLLTLARIRFTLATGTVGAKDTAAAWALPHLPPEHRPPLAHARRMYLGHRYHEERWSEELRSGVRPLADRMLSEIARLPHH